MLLVASRGEISWEGGGTLLPIVINLPQTYEKIHCKEEPYRFRDYRYPSVRTGSSTVTSLCKECHKALLLLITEEKKVKIFFSDISLYP